VEDKPEGEPAPEQKEWEKLTEGKFKSEDELAKAYKELETMSGKQSEEVRQSREFEAVVRPLLVEIRADPELFKQLDERLRKGKPTEPLKEPEAKGDEKVTDQDEMRTVASDLVLARFEERHGIDKLSPDKRSEMRQKIGDVIYDLTGKPFTGVDLRRLGGVLENAYILANKDTLIEKSKLEALASAQEVTDAGIPSVPSSPGVTEETLTSEEADVAGKLGLTREEYLAGKKSLAKVV